MIDPYQTFRGLSSAFHHAYFDWHSSGQYEGVREFDSVDDVVRRPPKRERDDWYRDECEVIDRSFRRLSDSRVLEIGCGDGNLTWKLANRVSRLRACDMDAGAVALTRSRLAELGITNADVRQGAAEDQVADDGLYDVVFFVQVLEHVPGWQQGRLFDHVFSLVAPGGCLFVSTPNRWTVRDVHDTGRLFIHWWPRWIRVPVARRLNWGLASHDPAWPYPPVLHDYVSFRWMWKRARRAHPRVEASRMSFYPTADAWFAAKARQPASAIKRAARRVLRHAGRVAPLNYYFGEKAIFAKRVAS
jgi:SAM-dependent methyltransferase